MSRGQSWVALLFGFILGAFVAYSCASKPETKPKLGLHADEKQNEVPRNATELSLKELEIEINIGRTLAGKLLKYYGVYEDEKLALYLNQVGTYLGTGGAYKLCLILFYFSAC